MRSLAREAVRRGETPGTLAVRLGWDPSALAKTFRAVRPQRRSIEELAQALFPSDPLVVRALLGEVTERDVAEARPLIIAEVALKRLTMFRDDTEGALRESLYGLGNGALHALCAAYVVARAGLDDEVDPLLGPTLGAVERTLTPLGFSLRPFIVNEGQMLREKREAVELWDRLRTLLPFTDQDESTIAAVIGRYVRGLELTPTDHIAWLDAQDVARTEKMRAQFPTSPPLKEGTVKPRPRKKP